MVLRFLMFMILNFGALAIGGLFTGKGVPSDWYAALNKAPWTPPGWVFGFAWTSIMIFFSFYMTYLWQATQNKKLLLGMYVVQWMLNVAWNPLFFHYHNTGLSLIVIALLTGLIGLFLFIYWPGLKLKSALLLPYFIWLLIATSLNGYIYLHN